MVVTTHSLDEATPPRARARRVPPRLAWEAAVAAVLGGALSGAVDVRAAAAADAVPQALPGGQTGAPATSGSATLLDRNRADRAPPVAAPPAAVSPSPVSSSVVREATSSPAFTVRRVQVDGATAPSALIRGATAPFVGRTLDADGAGAIADALAAAYAKTDVAISTVVLPRQTFAGGIVRVRVIEGRLEGVDVQSRDPRLAARVRALTAPLLRQAPLRRSAFDRVWLLVQSIPGVKAQVVFARGAKTGHVRLQIMIKVRRLKGGVGISDRGQNLLGRTQMSANVQLNGLFRGGDQTTLVLAAPTDVGRFFYVGLSHLTPLGDSGATAQLSFGHINTHPRGLDTRGEATVASLQVSYPVTLSGTRSLTVSGSLDAVDSSNALVGTVLTDERTRALRGSAAFVQSFHRGDGAVSLAATLSQGIDGLGAKALALGYSKADFRKLTVQAAATRRYGKWTVRLRATGQAGFDDLPASEQITLGGDDFGRAFASGVAMGDSGAAASAEIAYAPKSTLPLANAPEIYLFADAGRVRTFARPGLGLPGRTDELASAGVGARVTVEKHTALQVEVARALVEDTPYHHGDDWRLIVGLRTTY